MASQSRKEKNERGEFLGSSMSGLGVVWCDVVPWNKKKGD